MVGQHLTQGNYVNSLMRRTLLIMQSEICPFAQGSQGVYVSFVSHFEG